MVVVVVNFKNLVIFVVITATDFMIKVGFSGIFMGHIAYLEVLSVNLLKNKLWVA